MVEMDPSRAKLAADALKEIETIGKNVGKPAAVIKGKTPVVLGPTKVNAQGISAPVAGSGLLQIVMYIIAGVLLIGIILMVVDHWVYPIFQEKPGSPGFVLIPGTDTSDQFWTVKKEIQNIIIGTSNADIDTKPQPLYSTLLEGQSSYSMTMDVLINNEYTEDIPNGFNRTFCMIAPNPRNSPLQLVTPEAFLKIDLNPQINRVEITIADADHTIQTALLDNVPIHKPFRVGLVKTQYTMEAYLNGLLVKTIQLRGNTINPGTNGVHYIIAPQNIIGDSATPPSPTNATAKSLSAGIQVMNLRLFGYNVSPSEMRARMNDLTDISKFTPTS
jgi:hypothetical protein